MMLWKQFTSCHEHHSGLYCQRWDAWFHWWHDSNLLELIHLSTAESQQLCLTILIQRKIVSFHQITSAIQNFKLFSQHLLATLLKVFKITDCIPVIQKGMFLCFILVGVFLFKICWILLIYLMTAVINQVLFVLDC